MKMEPSLEPPASAPRAAFIVDDEALIRDFIAMTLRQWGFVISEFSCIEEIELALTRVVPEIVILDLSLGKSDAVDVMKSLAASRYRGKILLVSGHDAATIDGVQAIGRRFGLAMLPFLRKPVEIGELASRLVDSVKPPDTPCGATSLLSALENNWLELWYQPKIELASMSICGAEALIRLRHPEQGLLSPAAFLPPPGDPLYRALSDFVVRRVFADWPSLSAAWGNFRLAINVPVSVLQTPDFVDGMRRHLPLYPQFPGLIVEITEDEAINEPDIARDAAFQLRLHNIHVSVDDFGAGYSSLARLAELPFVELKLDRSFVSGCANDARKHRMCQSVANLAHRSKLTAVAEGVETREDLHALIRMGYDMAQGYYFERPMAVDKFIALQSTTAARNWNPVRLASTG